MLFIAKQLREIAFAELMHVYEEGNRENGAELWPDLPENQRSLQAEQDFYQYLREVFYTTPGAMYCIWQESGHYRSALRLEPYQDGLLLEALETAPEDRRKGYAGALIRAVLDRCGQTNIYSHVHKQNHPSLAVHESCGFRRLKEYAVYVDGSVNQRCCTMVHDADAANRPEARRQ